MVAATGDTWLVWPLTGTVEHVTAGWEADALEASGWKAFPTEAAAKAFAGQGIAKRYAGEITSPATSALNGILPQLTNTRSLVSRTVRVIGGLILVFVGLNMLSKEAVNVDVISAAKSLPKIVPV
jgi:hypothetical protein